MVDTTNKTFVYEGKEWTLTGRVAKKAIFHKRVLNRKVGTMTIVEIAPDGPGGSDTSFHRWVDPRDLFYISEADEINIEAIKKNNEDVDEQDN